MTLIEMMEVRLMFNSGLECQGYEDHVLGCKGPLVDALHKLNFM